MRRWRPSLNLFARNAGHTALFKQHKQPLQNHNQLFTQNGRHFEKNTILDFQMATKLHEIIPVALKTYKRTPRSFKAAECIIF